MKRLLSVLFSRATAFVLGLAVGLYLIGLVWFAEAIPRHPADRGEMTDAIVVLTGGPLRLKEGFSLLLENRAKKMLVSGVARGVELNELLRVAGTPPLSVACCVELGYVADNTASNADETRAWMAKENFTSLRLVTANYHMPRSLLEFRRAMPAVHIVPHPVFPENFKRDDWWAWRGTFTLVALEYNKYLLTLVRTAVTPGRRG
jgi:uncharacterized SAM-binding protein YcdF (DUF218 family)